jgi:hypothetical protein
MYNSPPQPIDLGEKNKDPVPDPLKIKIYYWRILPSLNGMLIGIIPQTKS